MPSRSTPGLVGADEQGAGVAEIALTPVDERAMVVATRRELMLTLLASHPHVQVEELVRKARGAEEYILGP